jgi:signal transduction histidine kinase
VPNPAAPAWTGRVGSAAVRWPERDPLLVDALLVAAIIAAAFAPAMAAAGPEIADLPTRPRDAVWVALVFAQCAPLVLRRRWPVLCLALVGGAFMARELLRYPITLGGIGLYIALYSVGAYRVRRWAPVAAGGIAGYAAFALALHRLGSPEQPSEFVAFGAVLALAWGAGAAVRQWREQEALLRRDAAERATAAERARIARELHDVVTHHVTAMVVQADAAQFVIGAAPARAAEGLTAIAGTGRRALTELRALLDVLEATGESAPTAPTPTLRSLSDLCEQARRAGQPVELTETGPARPLPVDAELTAYRVVQEALTNAMKYATGSRTVVRVEHSRSGVEIEVTSAAATTAVRPPGTGSGGRGLPALRDRVRSLGGDLEAGPGRDGGFRVRASIPCEAPLEVGS